MKRKNPKFTHGYVDQHGRPRFYLRRPGHAKIPLPGLPWSPEFMEARQTALDGDAGKVEIGAKRTVDGSVSHGLIGYYKSNFFTGLADSSQKMRRAELERFRNDHGDKRVVMMHAIAIQNILNGKTPAAQRNFRKALRGYIDYCLSVKLMKVDPLLGAKLSKLKTIGHHPWESAECEQFEEHHAVGTRARLAYELLLQAGQSKCDVVRMGRQHVRKGMMTMKRQKTGTPFNVEITPRLQAAIDAMPASNHLTFLITAEGNGFTAAGFGNWFREMCRVAKLPARCTSHGLRKAAATYLAELGATDHQLMAWFGWSSISQAQVYTKAARGKVLSQATGRLITGTGIGSPINPVSQNDDQDTEIVEVKK
ncbi:tyrosine-type recombinase/integrase [Bradyrhizobium lablabi]|uniref:tyrosine-type recombinase/integrase n=1 Tax=Bradyrhizobium lablabi TaxID=722472 RepID=UPI000909D72D|nr:tyrosine-type recombinase/integrase [Bradyrhizobium lablabi]SHM37725.1 Site-specific recombinase XerD [Bradyrhizobium lablabi]